MNLAAAEFVPTFVPAGSDTVSTTVPADEQPQPNLVLVNRGGCSFYVQEGDAAEVEPTAKSLDTPHDPTAVDWTEGTSFYTPELTSHRIPSSVPTPLRKSLATMVLPEPLRQHLQAQSKDMLRQLEPDDDRYKEIPPRYHSVWHLDKRTSKTKRHASGSLGYPSSIFKVVSEEDGVTYALRRMDKVRTTAKIAAVVMEQWQHVRHPNIARLQRAFVYNKALFFLHEYWPTAQTLAERYIDAREPITERMLWSYLVQLSAAVRTVHSLNMACRCISPTHIMVTSGSRVRLGAVGIVDVVEYDQMKTLSDHQREDIIALGHTIIGVACRAYASQQNLQQCIMTVAQHFSADMHNVLFNLITKPTSIFDVCTAIAPHAFEELNMMYGVADALEVHLGNEVENGRLLKLLIKLGTINERPEHQMNPNWADTGDRYVLKLFRDYLFHQTDDNGDPVVDIGHIVNALNKVDAGDTEQVILTSPDQQSVFVASFEDIRRCADSAFHELVPPPTDDLHLHPTSRDGLLTQESMVHSGARSLLPRNESVSGHGHPMGYGMDYGQTHSSRTR